MTRLQPNYILLTLCCLFKKKKKQVKKKDIVSQGEEVTFIVCLNNSNQIDKHSLSQLSLFTYRHFLLTL